VQVDIAVKLKSPLSTIQRRRAKLERTILKRQYMIDSSNTDWRQAELFMQVENGKTEELGKEVFEKYKDNITLMSLTMNNIGNLIAHIYFRRSEEIFAIAEDIRTNPNVDSLLFAEHLKVLGERSPKFILEDMQK